ncbi:CHAT domain-containing protein [Saccharopolyspora rosea]|uniref:CHAT domain-containing protein n=1 Tax=Saccharopolyspora rosea TaxID=524884 RepID=A0ABW3FP66_9PSEU|nr:CHAT domain-containing protein [Saccharopolyspora rosea]
MTDDANRAKERFRGLQRWRGSQDRGGSSSSWFSEAHDDSAETSAPQPRVPGQAPAPAPQQAPEPRRTPEQRYADAIAAMNNIVSTLDFQALPWVTEVFRATAGVLSEDNPARAGVLNNLGSASQLHYLRSDDLAHLEDAIAYYRSASDTAHSGDQDLVLYRCNLVLALNDYAKRTSGAESAAEAVAVARETARTTSQRDPRRVMVLVRLAHALKLHARLAADTGSDDASIDAFRDAVRISPAREQATAELLINLGAALLRRYGRGEDIDDLDEGIKHLGAGAGGLSDGDPRRSALCHLAHALRLRFQRNGDLTDLNSAINELVGVLGVLDTGHRLLGRAVWHLAATAIEHVDATGEPSQLRRVLRPIGPAVRAMAADDAHRATALAAYGALLRRHFQHGAEAGVLDTAVTAGEAAADAATDEQRSAVLTSLVVTLLARFEQSGDLGDLDRAEEIARQAASAATPDTAAQHAARTQLGAVALQRFRRLSKSQDLETAVELLDQALTEMPATAPVRATAATHLGRALRTLHHRSGRRRYYRWARKVLVEAAEQPTAPADQRLRAAAQAGRLAAQTGRWSEAVESFTTAVELLPLVTRGKQVVAAPAAQQRWALVAADAAAAALESGEPERAVELLEYGRTAILSEFLPAGGELGALHRTHPDLADEAVRLRRLLDRPPREPVLDGVDDRTRLAAAWDDLVAEARQVQDGHLRLKPFAELSEAARDGAVVLVNLSRYRSDALVVFAGRVLTVPLPKADPEGAAERTAALLTAAQQGDQAAASEVLEWTWQRMARPVLDRMGYVGAPQDRWPRLWWSSAGPAAYLPLHAAAQGDQCVLDRVVSSYTPTLGCLLRSHRRPLPDGGTALVAAGSAQQIGRELPRQNQILAQHWPSAAIVSTESTTAPDVLRMLPEHPWLHVCEPSSQYPGQPAAGLVLDRDPQRSLGLVELGQVTLDQAEFGYLGQCATAADSPSAAAVPLPAAMCFAGYTHALGALWEVDEDAANRVHADVYAEVFGADFDTDRSGPALHAATRKLRQESPETPLSWAAQVHAGP